MAENPLPRMIWWPGAVWTVGVLAAWSALAIRSPHLTYHFAPLVAAAAWPLLLRRNGRQETHIGFLIGGASFALTVLVSLVLWATDNLAGPTFVESDGAVVEAVLFAGIGAVIGSRSATSEREGLLARLVTS